MTIEHFKVDRLIIQCDRDLRDEVCAKFFAQGFDNKFYTPTPGNQCRMRLERQTPGAVFLKLDAALSAFPQ